jgi:hypothetical protein
MPLQIRRGTEDQRQDELVDLGRPLLPGEPLFVTDDQRLYIGDGVTPGGVLVTGFNANDALVSAANGLVAGNAFNPNISFLFGLTQQTNSRVEARIDLENYEGEIGASAFRGPVLAIDSSTLVDSQTASINLDGTIKGDAIPFSDSLHDLGDMSHRFKKLFLADDGIMMGQATITASGTTVDLPVDSTVGGVPIAAIAPGVDYQVNIINADSTRIVDSENSTFTGYFNGDLKGSVFADDSTPIVDAVNRKLYGNEGVYGDLTNFAEEIALRVFDRKAFLNQLRFGDTAAIGAGVLEAQSITALIDDSFTIVSDGAPSPTAPVFSVLSASNSVEGDTIALVRQRGPALSPAPVQLNDEIGNFGFAGFDGASYLFAGGITGLVDGTVSAGVVPTRMELKVNDPAGVEKTIATVKSTKFEMNGVPFKLPVYADDAARDAAIPAPEVGMIVFMLNGTSPSATNKAQVSTVASVGGWVNLH